MRLLHRLIVALALLAGIAPAFAQAPPPVPALPDTERRTSFSLNAQTGPFSVGFALYGDSTDYAEWLQVWLCTSATLTPCSQLTAVTQWTLSSPTGPLATIPRPITDATITLTSAQTGTLQIVGARRPRRTSQFAENRGVAARDINQYVTDLTAQNREDWDLGRRMIQAQPGEVLSVMQPASTRAGGILCWDATGLIPQTCAAGSSGTANVVGPNVSVVGHIATFGNTLGTILTDGGLVGAGNLIGPSPSASTVNHAAAFKDSGGINIIDSGLTLTPSTGTFTLTNAKTLTVTNSLTLSGTDSTTMTFPSTSATIARTDAANTFTGHQTIEGVTSTGATGTGNLVFATAPTLGLTTVSSLIMSSGLISPSSDSTTALQITNAASVRIVDIDTSNARVGINKTPGSFDLDVNGNINTGGTLTFLTLDPSSLGSSTTTVTGLSTQNTIVAGADYVPYFSSTDGKIRKATVASIASANTSGVSALNGLTGSLSVAASGASNVAASGSTVTVATPDHYVPQNCTLAASVGSNILTVALKDNSGADPSATSPCRIPFRSSTATTGSTVIDGVTGALSITTNATGATLGSANSTAFRFWVIAFDNSGTVVLSLFNASSSTKICQIDETQVQTSVAISGSATSTCVYYTPNGTTLTSKAIKILGYIEYNSTGLVTAGTYATGPNFIQTFGPGVKKPGEVVQTFTSTTTSQTSTANTFTIGNTAPVAASGATVASQAITPTSAANITRIRGQALVLSSGSAFVITYLVNTTGPTTVATAGGFNGGVGGAASIPIFYQGILNTTSATTFTQYYSSNTGTSNLNTFQNGSSNFAGTSISGFTIEEIMG
jgi:hypothetical protein